MRRRTEQRKRLREAGHLLDIAIPIFRAKPYLLLLAENRLERWEGQFQGENFENSIRMHLFQALSRTFAHLPK